MELWCADGVLSEDPDWLALPWFWPELAELEEVLGRPSGGSVSTVRDPGGGTLIK